MKGNEMTKIRKTCKHCRTRFLVDEGNGGKLCPNCMERKWTLGTLRECGNCGFTWTVREGDCGYTLITDSGSALELCEKCEKHLATYGTLKGEYIDE